MQDAAIGFGSAVSLFFGWMLLSILLTMVGVPLAAAVWCVGILCLLAFLARCGVGIGTIATAYRFIQESRSHRPSSANAADPPIY